MFKPGKEQITAQVVNMDPNTAKMLRKTAHFERQRPIRQANVDRLQNEMKHGWFVEGTPIFIAVLPDESMLILNGNHTLEAVAASGVTLALVVIFKRVADFNEAAHIYANMDIQQIRSWRNALQALEGDAASAFDAKVIAALGLIMTNFVSGGSTASNSRTARFELFEEYGNAGQLIENAIRHGIAKNKQYVNRAPVLAVALVAAKWQPVASEEFWSAFVKDDGLRANDPIKALLRYLSNYSMTTGSGTQRVNQAKAAALAWNAFYEHRQLEAVKPNQVKILTIMGTPWHKGTPDEKAESRKYKPMTPVVADKIEVETGQDIHGKVISRSIRRAKPTAPVLI